MPKGERGTSKPFLRGRIWWIEYYVPGDKKPRRESSKSESKTVAVRLLNQRKAEVDCGQVAAGEPTVNNLLEIYLRDQRKHNRKSLQDAETNVREHLQPALGAQKASQITSILIDRFIETKRQAGYSNASINRYLSALKRAFNLGRKVKPPLVWAAPEIGMLEEDNLREGFLEHPEYLRIRDLLPDHQRTILVIGYHLGMRAGEIINLRWDQVDWHHNLIRLEKRQTKGKQARVAPMYGELRGWLVMAYASRGECPFLVNYQGGPISEYKRAWNTARLAAGLPNLLVHDLRRTAVRNMIRAGIPEKQAMLISGHKTRSVFDRYDITDERDIKIAGVKLELYLNELASSRGKIGTKEGTVVSDGELANPNRPLQIQ